MHNVHLQYVFPSLPQTGAYTSKHACRQSLAGCLRQAPLYARVTLLSSQVAPLRAHWLAKRSTFILYNFIFENVDFLK